MRRPFLASCVFTVLTVSCLAWPAALEALRPPPVREGWRRDLHVVEPREAVRLLREGAKVVFVDVREAEEYDDCRIPGALHVPVRELGGADLSGFRDADLVIPYCFKDLRGFEGARALVRRGVPHVALLEGYGMNAWGAARLPFAGVATGLDDRAALEALLRP